MTRSALLNAVSIWLGIYPDAIASGGAYVVLPLRRRSVPLPELTYRLPTRPLRRPRLPALNYAADAEGYKKAWRGDRSGRSLDRGRGSRCRG